MSLVKFSVTLDFCMSLHISTVLMNDRTYIILLIVNKSNFLPLSVTFERSKITCVWKFLSSGSEAPSASTAIKIYNVLENRSTVPHVHLKSVRQTPAQESSSKGHLRRLQLQVRRKLLTSTSLKIPLRLLLFDFVRSVISH